MQQVLGGLAGAAVGFALSASVYVLVNPRLEAAEGAVRELQGLLWNIVPLLTAAGFALGLWWAARHPRGNG